MTYFVLIHQGIDLFARDETIDLGDKLIIEGTEELKKQLEAGNDYQVIRVYAAATHKKYIKPDEIVAYYATVAEALAQEASLDRLDLARFTALLIEMLVDDAPISSSDSDCDSDSDSDDDEPARPAPGEIAYAVACIAATRLTAASALDSRTLGLNKNCFLTVFSGHAQNTILDLHRDCVYATQISIAENFARENKLLTGALSVAEEFYADTSELVVNPQNKPSDAELTALKNRLFGKYRDRISTDKVYLILTLEHSYFVTFTKIAGGAFSITKLELDEFSYMPTKNISTESDETDAYLELLESLSSEYTPDASNSLPLNFSLLELTVTPLQLDEVFAQFEIECNDGRRTWGVRGIFSGLSMGDIPSQRNCHAFVYAILQQLAAQHAAYPRPTN